MPLAREISRETQQLLTDSIDKAVIIVSANEPIVYGCAVKGSNPVNYE